MNADQLLAKSVYKTFLGKDGNEFIAGDYSLYSIFRIVRFFKVNHVLEVGLGIGCIGYGAMQFAAQNGYPVNYSATEDNAFCLESVSKNLAQYLDKIAVFNNIAEVRPAQKFELVIVDGGNEKLAAIKDLIAPAGIIFVEGGRALQVDVLHRYFPKKLQVELITARKNPAGIRYAENSWYGGGTLIFINPTVRQRLFYWKEKILTSFKFRVLRKVGR